MAKSNDILVKIENEVERFNKSFTLDNEEEARAIRADASTVIEELEQDYNKLVRYEAYQEFAKDENPLVKAILTLEIPRLKVRTLSNEDGTVTGMSVYDKDGNLNVAYKVVDLADFDKYMGNTLCPDKLWTGRIEKFTQLMTLKVALELGLTKAERDKIGKTFYLSKVAEKMEAGETPTSNTQALKNLQEVIDAIIYEDNDGKNKYKATSHDVAYIDHLITKRGKALLTISVQNTKIVRELITGILYRMLTDGKYNLEYKTKKSA